MAPQALRPLFLLSSFFIAALVSSSCGEQDYPDTAFRCDPRDSASCPTNYVCCSTDATAIDLDTLAAAVPTYAGGPGLAVFSGSENDAGRHGRCVDRSAVPEGLAMPDDEGAAGGCPLPCNPKWADADITSVCGADAFCCPTDEIGEDDCVLDPDAGDGGCWRPVVGQDINTLGGLDATTWSSGTHDTHQDPGGGGCKSFASRIGPSTLEGAGVTAQDVERACYIALTVGDRRGFCTAANGEDEATVCPLSDPSHRDACEAMNDAESRTGCDAVEFP